MHSAWAEAELPPLAGAAYQERPKIHSRTMYLRLQPESPPARIPIFQDQSVR